ncbi:MAG: hypothetical protein ACI9WU_002369 [Myxococcota bacterium]|jgi:hypothetical protein
MSRCADRAGNMRLPRSTDRPRRQLRGSRAAPHRDVGERQPGHGRGRPQRLQAAWVSERRHAVQIQASRGGHWYQVHVEFQEADACGGCGGCGPGETCTNGKCVAPGGCPTPCTETQHSARGANASRCALRPVAPGPAVILRVAPAKPWPMSARRSAPRGIAASRASASASPADAGPRAPGANPAIPERGPAGLRRATPVDVSRARSVRRTAAFARAARTPIWTVGSRSDAESETSRTSL